MKKRISTYLSLALISGVVLSFAGSLSGALAWYAYSTRVTAEYTGTSVVQAEQLQVGILTDTDLSAKGLTSEAYDGFTVAWAKAGGGLSADAIQTYLATTDYASTQITPVTSREFSTGDDLTLYQAPIAGHPLNTNVAPHNYYVKIPFVFRVIVTDNNGVNSYAKNQNIWLTDCRAEASGEGEVYKAVRAHMSSDVAKFILNPSVEKTSSDDEEEIAKAKQGGDTLLAGLLDLNNDGYYDIDFNDPRTGDYELLYGEYDSTLTTSYNENDTEIADVNNVGQSSTETTFVAKHKGNTNIYSSLEGLNAKKAHYETLDSIMPDDDGAGNLTGGKPLVVTGNNSDALGFMDMSIFLEGWDHSVIDTEINHSFNLGLQFQINRV